MTARSTPEPRRGAIGRAAIALTICAVAAAVSTGSGQAHPESITVPTSGATAISTHPLETGADSPGVHIFRPETAVPSVDFDWSMPDRYGADRNGDGLIDSFQPDGPLEIVPEGYRVDFAASGVDTCSSPSTRRWSIDGAEVTASDPNVLGGDPASCSFAYRFAAEGTYQVTLEIGSSSGGALASAAHEVAVQDFLIVSIGDSVASGEGNPDVPPAWQSRQCHRSALAGPAQAAHALEAADKRTSVTFLHLACSGATVVKGLLGGYAGTEPAAILPPQVTALANLARSRVVEAVLVSIGANDVQFSQLVRRCLIRPACQLGSPGSAATFFGKLLPRLPGRYDQLGAALAGASIAADRVFITEYFDPTRDDSGKPCDRTILADHPAALSGRVAITASEAAWASNVMLASLNAAVVAAAGRNGWSFVGGIRSEFLSHGYCANDNWVVTYGESQHVQGDEYGTLHPNWAGHSTYAARLFDRLRESLWVGGDLSLDPPICAGGGSRLSTPRPPTTRRSQTSGDRRQQRSRPTW